MTINKNIDIIRQGNKDYVNVNSKNRLIAKLIATSAEQVYAFPIPFRASVDNQTAEEMKDTYWLRVTQSDNVQYGENVNVVVL